MIYSKFFPYVRAVNQKTDISFPKIRLFCLAHSGGVASIFRNWPDYLPSTFEVFPIQLPGREARFKEPLLTSMKQVIDSLWPEILQFLDAPIALFGHSLGGLIAFELLKKIQFMRLETKATLLVSACSPPHLLTHTCLLHTLPKEAFFNHLKKYGAMPQQLLENREALATLFPRLQADFSIFETYSYLDSTPLKMPIIAFGADQDEVVPYKNLLEWKKYTTESFINHKFSGGHFYYQNNPQELCKEISNVLIWV